MNGELLATVGEEITEYRVDGLIPWQGYSFEVEVIDLSGNIGAHRLSVNMRTLDDTHPSWPAGAQLSYDNLTDSSVSLNWPVASDPQGVRYELYRDGEVYRTLDNGELSLSLDGLLSNTSYYFSIVAIDPAGNSSEPLGLALRTADAPEWRPEEAAQDLSRRLLITLHITGAWDVSYAFDPKGYTFENEELRITNYSAGQVQQPSYESPIRWAPSTSNNAFFEEMGQRLLIINGVDVGSNVDLSATRSVMSGEPVQLYPTIGALHAAINAKGAPLALIHHGGYQETRGLVPVSRMQQKHLETSIPLPNDHSYGIHDTDYTRANQLMKRRMERRLAANSFPPHQEALEAMLSASSVGGLEYFTEYDNGTNRNGYLKPSVHSGLVAFKAGLSAALNIKFYYPFSVPEGTYLQLSFKYGYLWSALTDIWNLVEGAGLEEQVIVMVVCPLGRTALPGLDGAKLRWPTTSYLFFGAGIEGNRVIGATDNRMLPRPVNPDSPGVTDENGVVLTTGHVHAALRDLLGISDHPLAREYPLNAPVLPIFMP